MIDLNTAVGVVGNGLRHLRSVQQPAEYSQIEGIEILRDTNTNSNQGDAVLVASKSPTEIVNSISRCNLRNNYSLHHFLNSDSDVQACVQEYDALGFTLTNQHYLIAQDLQPRVRTIGKWSVQRAETILEVNSVEKIAKQKLVSLEDMPPSSRGVRLYYAHDGARIMGWVRSAQVSDVHSWNDDLFTVPEYRRKGAAADLMELIHADDSDFGVETTVSFSTPENFVYHERFGYQKIGVKLRFLPKKSFLQTQLLWLKSMVKSKMTY